MEVTVWAPAKLNLTLDVTGLRDDGYHLIHTVMQTVDCMDILTVSLCEGGGISVKASDKSLPQDNRNLAWKAAAAFFAYTGMHNPGVEIEIDKHIPIEAGLAGGSADAAAVLVALNHLCGLALPPEEICDIAEDLGADVPFCVMGGTAEATGTGTILLPLPPLPDCYVVIGKPDACMSTAAAYARIDAGGINRRPCLRLMADAICENDLPAVGNQLCNVFEQVTALPEVEELKSLMRQFDPLGCQMTGSGSAVFALFSEKTDAVHCLSAVKKQYPFAVLCHPCNHGALVHSSSSKG